LIVLDIRAVVNLVAAATLPTLYYPYDIALGVRFNFFGATTYAGTASSLTAQSQTILNNINSATAGFTTVVLLMFIISYIWIGALSTTIVGTLKPEFSMPKRIAIAAVSAVVTILASLLLVGLI